MNADNLSFPMIYFATESADFSYFSISSSKKYSMSSNSTRHYEFVISTSWTVESENKDLKSSITLNSSNNSVELDDVVQLETCVHLVQGDKVEEPCTINISVPETSTDFITQLVIVSEARIVELFGSCGEYLSTCTAEYVDDFEGCAVYMAECRTIPTQQVLIKFQKAKHAGSLWLYGINLTTCKNKCTMPPLSGINFQTVNDILKDAKIPISENAEKCKTFLQAYSGVSTQSQPFFKGKPPNPQMLMKMLEAEYFNPISERGKNMSKCFSNFVPFLSKECSEKTGMPESEISYNKSGHSSELILLKSYIDKRFTDLECKIERFEQKMKELEIRQNDKLDHIIALLNKQNS